MPAHKEPLSAFSITPGDVVVGGPSRLAKWLPYPWRHQVQKWMDDQKIKNIKEQLPERYWKAWQTVVAMDQQVHERDPWPTGRRATPALWLYGPQTYKDKKEQRTAHLSSENTVREFIYSNGSKWEDKTGAPHEHVDRPRICMYMDNLLEDPQYAHLDQGGFLAYVYFHEYAHAWQREITLKDIPLNERRRPPIVWPWPDTPDTQWFGEDLLNSVMTSTQLDAPLVFHKDRWEETYADVLGALLTMKYYGVDMCESIAADRERDGYFFYASAPVLRQVHTQVDLSQVRHMDIKDLHVITSKLVAAQVVLDIHDALDLVVRQPERNDVDALDARQLLHHVEAAGNRHLTDADDVIIARVHRKIPLQEVSKSTQTQYPTVCAIIQSFGLESTKVLYPDNMEPMNPSLH